MFRSQVKTWFNEAVRLNTEAPQELKDVLLRGHPNLDNFINNVEKQLVEADAILQKRGKVVKLETLKGFVYDLTNMFLKGFEGEAKRRYESDLERLKREAEEQAQKEMDAFLEGDTDNEFGEAGVITNEEIDKVREDKFKKEYEDRQREAQKVRQG